MTIYNVLNNFKKFIEEVARNERLLTKTNQSKMPQIKLGYLEDNEYGEEKEDFPYIVIRYLKDQVSEESATVNIKVLFGVYSEDSEGWMDILHCMELIKREILKKQNFDFYTVELPIKCTIPEEQPFPNFIGTMELDLTIPRIEIEGDEEPWPA